jgi:hypothetical protein
MSNLTNKQKKKSSLWTPGHQLSKKQLKKQKTPQNVSPKNGIYF